MLALLQCIWETLLDASFSCSGTFGVGLRYERRSCQGACGFSAEWYAHLEIKTRPEAHTNGTGRASQTIRGEAVKNTDERRLSGAYGKLTIGQRVQVHPASDTWMRGDRYGVIESFGAQSNYARVRMDRSGRLRLFHPDLLIPTD